ncbi:MAG: DoxX family protein [Anaerolineales bacterium]|nr:DoxX family protein [Anaerolineales bacterium]
MDTVLWALQIILAIKFATVAFTHGVRPDPVKMARGRQRLGAAARPLLTLIAAAVLLGGLGLILPAALGMWPWLTAWAAALLAGLMLAALGLHLACRDQPNSLVSLILFALAAFLAYGRWVLAPL